MIAKVWMKETRAIFNIRPNKQSAHSKQNASLTRFKIEYFKMCSKFVRFQKIFVNTYFQNQLEHFYKYLRINLILINRCTLIAKPNILPSVFVDGLFWIRFS